MLKIVSGLSDGVKLKSRCANKFAVEADSAQQGNWSHDTMIKHKLQFADFKAALAFNARWQYQQKQPRTSLGVNVRYRTA